MADLKWHKGTATGTYVADAPENQFEFAAKIEKVSGEWYLTTFTHGLALHGQTCSTLADAKSAGQRTFDYVNV